MFGFLSLSLVQLVSGVAIVVGPCPALPGPAVNCYIGGQQPTIYVLRAELRPGRFQGLVLLHEYGHAYDDLRLTDADRSRFKRLLGYRQSWGWWQEQSNYDINGDRLSPAERFAEEYAICALGLRIRWKRICRLLPPSKLALVAAHSRRWRAWQR